MVCVLLHTRLKLRDSYVDPHPIQWVESLMPFGRPVNLATRLIDFLILIHLLEQAEFVP